MTDERQAEDAATGTVAVPPKSLLRRAFLLYRPARALAWRARAFFYLFAFALVPSSCLLALGAYLGPDAPWSGVPAVVFLVFVTFLLRRRAILVDGKFRPPGDLTTPGGMLNHLPFRLEEPPQRRPVLGWLYSASGIVLAAVGVISESTTRKGFRLLEYGRGLRARDGRERLQSRAGEPPVLLLRSFEDEEMPDPKPQQVLMRRYEETLSRALEIFGPVIAIARPGDGLRFGGAGRLFVSDNDWQKAARYLLAHAGVVAIIAGRTGGLWWEIDEALRVVDRDRLLFFFPHVRDSELGNEASGRWRVTRSVFEEMERERRDRYRVFRDRLLDQVAGRLPEDLGEAVFLDFLADGEARLLGPRYPSVLQYSNPFTGKNFLADILTLPRYRRLRFDMSQTVAPFVAKLYETRH